MQIVCFGQQNWDYCWTGKQHLMSRLARRGHHVLYVDPDWATGTLSAGEALSALNLTRSGAGLRAVADRLHVFTYRFNPLLRWRLNVLRWQSGRAVAAIARRLGFSHPVAVSLRPDTGRMMQALRPKGQLYYAVDEWSAFPGADEQKAEWRASEESLLRLVDVALCVSPRLLQRFAGVQPRSYLLENGADIDHFAPVRLSRCVAHPAVAGLPRPRLGFVGQIDTRLDQDLVVAIARRHREWHIVLAGRVQAGTDISRLEAEPNITLLGYQPYDALPGMLRELDVCLVPYRIDELTNSCNPLKVFEYLATGKPVVSRPLEGLRAARSGVALASTAGEFIAAIERALASPDAGRHERLSLAAANTWDARVDAFEEYLHQAAQAARPRPGRGFLIRPAASRPVQMWPRRRSTLSWRSRLAFAAIGAAGWVYYSARVGARLLRRQRHPTVRRILVIRANAFLGDFIVLQPTLDRLRSRYPEAHIVLGTYPGTPPEPLCRAVDETRLLSDVFERTSRLRAGRVFRWFVDGFDVVLSGSGYFLHREALWCGAPYRLGLDEWQALEAFNTHTVPYDATVHDAENNLALADALCGFDPAGRVPRIVLDDAESRQASAKVRRRLLVSGERTITMHPGSKRPSRRWPADRFAALATRLLAEDPRLQVVFSGVDSEKPLVEQIRGMIPPPLRGRAVSAAGATDLPALIGLLDDSAAVVSNDTGTMHLARARGAPLVALLGPENDRVWGPHPLGTGPAISLRHEVPCAPCRQSSCDLLACMKLLSVEEAYRAVRELIDAPRHPPGTVQPLVRRVHRHDWVSVSEDGCDPPVATVVSRVAPGSHSSAETQLQAALESIVNQTYPALEWLIVAQAGMILPPLPGATGLAVSVLRTGANGNGWRDAAQHAAGPFIAIMRPGDRWPRQRISDDVARLVRTPHLVACEHATNAATAQVPDDPEGLTIRREALLARR